VIIKLELMVFLHGKFKAGRFCSNESSTKCLVQTPFANCSKEIAYK
jgi:hypothetical protein